MTQGRKIDTLDQAARQIWPLSWVSGSVIQGDCYQSQDPDGQSDMLVWLSRDSLSGEEQVIFDDHARKLLKLAPKSDVDFGVDSENRAFFAIAGVSGKRINYDSPSLVALRNRYLRCLFIVGNFHREGQTCGNLSPSSFSVSPDGKPEFVGYLGGFERSTVPERTEEIRRFVRPSDRHPGKPSAAADVYALAVIGLEIFGVNFGSGEIDLEDFDRYLDQIPDNAPPWVFSVLATIARDPNHTLCRDVRELLKSLEVGEGAYLRELRQTKRGAPLGGGDDQPLTFQQLREEFATRAELLRRRIDQIAESKFLKIGLSLVAAVMMIPFVTTHFLSPNSRAPESETTGDNESKQIVDNRDDAAKTLWNIVNQAKRAKEELIRSGVSATGALKNSVNTMLSIASQGDPLLEYISKLSPDSEDGKKVIEAYMSADEESRATLSGAIIDAGGRWNHWYKGYLISSIERTGFTGREFLDSLGTDALFLAAETRMSSRSGEIWARQSKISNDQLWWLLQFHAKKRTPLIPFLASEARQRNLLEWPKGVFLEAMMNAEEGSFPPYEPLYRAAKGGLLVSDVNAIAAWNDPLAIRSLYAVSLSTRDTALLNRAVTGLVLQPVFDQSPRPVLEWLRNSQEIELWRYARIIGGLGLNSAEADPFLMEGLRDLKDEASFGAIVTALIDNGSALAVQALLRVYGGDVHPDRLIKLLGHPDRNVRKDVIPFLKQVRITSSKEKIRDMYEREKDPDIRRRYESEIFQGKAGIGSWLVDGADKDSAPVK